MKRRFWIILTPMGEYEIFLSRQEAEYWKQEGDEIIPVEEVQEIAILHKLDFYDIES